MPSLLLFLAMSCALGLSSASDLDPDEKAFLSSISMGRGLYYNYPHIVNLNSTNFDALVKGKDYSWVIEFYNSWCGHCLRFTPTYKRLANDVKGWSHVVKFGAVDCSMQLNLPLCRDYEILLTPTLKYFAPHVGKDDEGMVIPKRTAQIDKLTMMLTVHDLRNNITEELMLRSDLPRLKQLENFKLLPKYRKPQSKYLVMVFEGKSLIGPQLVLDYWSVGKVTVVPTACRRSILEEFGFNHCPTNTLLVIPAANSFENSESESDEEEVLMSSFSRSEALTKLHSYFKNRGIEVPKPFNLSSIKDISDDLKIAFAQINTGKRPYKHTNEVFQVDIEGALIHTLDMEIPVHKRITGEALKALQNYLLVLFKYFPIGKGGKEFLKCVYNTVLTKENGITGKAFVGTVEECTRCHDPGYVEPNNGWVRCHGSFPMFRGFPCSMWTMFHTLTVQAYHKKAKDPQEVLRAMKGYIKNFFGCSDCANHFMKMTANMEKEVRSLEDSVLYLWAAHNKANKRLHGDATEDPHFPKVQFPTNETCQECHNENGSFNKKVLKFLHHMYTNINSKVTPTQLGFNTTYAGRM